jgi:hypothetical protein
MDAKGAEQARGIPDKARVGSVLLRKVPEGKTPAHYLWKRFLEREWAGEWTLAKLTSYRYKLGLDPSFVEELPEFKKGRIHFYEWILCENGGIIYLYSEKDMILSLLTTKQTADKVLAAGVGASIYLTQDDRLSHELHFLAAKVMEVCELAGARRARRVSEEQKAKLRERGLRVGFGSRERYAANRASGGARTPKPERQGKL